VLATLARLAIAPLVGTAVPFITYFIATILLAWYKGFWPAAISLPLSSALGLHYFLRAGAVGILTYNKSINVSIAGFIVSSLAASFVIDVQRRISERARAAELAAELSATKLLQSNNELRRVNQDLELFAYSASHDLREPLRTIALSAQILQKSAIQQPAGLNFVEQILTASRRMESLLSDILDYTSNAGAPETPAAPIDSGRVLREVLEGLKGSIQESGAEITAGELPEIAVQENRLALVFQNLISNAIKYRAAEPPRIRVDAHVSHGCWVFSVTDNGIGIDEKFSEQIFGLFKRLHTQSAYQGSGMGLAICRRVIEQYGGRIWLERSEPGQGSTFCFSLPLPPRPGA
jgi:light-regulated signal transduction histidine kinase (bacteriophytochrome)